MMRLKLCAAIFTSWIHTTCAASDVVRPQTNIFNSTVVLSAAQIAGANVSAETTDSIAVAAQFERSNWATGSVYEDAFYTRLPTNASSKPAGSVLRVEAFTNTSLYTIAPSLALSRIIYQSLTVNGSVVPVSAYLLWPYRPRNGASKAPLVSWGHGTSGVGPECAPSHLRNLWYHFTAPYQLALAGYAVVGTDYAGLGVPYHPDGRVITHQYLASTAAGNDLLYAAQAAHAAFPDALTEEFVVMGHSQGGGAAWAAAQQQLIARVPGYLGSIAAAPVTNVIKLAEPLTGSDFALLLTAKSILSIFPDLKISDVVSSAGAQLLQLYEEIRGCNSVFNVLLQTYLAKKVPLVQHEFVRSPYAPLFANVSTAGGRDFADPLLVLQGGADNVIKEPATSFFVNQTCHAYPDRSLTYVKAAGARHIPMMYATQQIWLAWLAERFSHRKDDLPPAKYGGRCKVEEIGSKTLRPLEQYQGDPNYFLEWAAYGYETA